MEAPPLYLSDTISLLSIAYEREKDELNKKSLLE